MKTIFSFCILITFICLLNAEPVWDPVIYTGLGTTHYGYITIDDIPASTNDLLGVFVDGECRAAGHPVSEGLIAGLRIQGPDGIEEMLQFRLWDADNDVILDNPDLISVTNAGDDLFMDLDLITPNITESLLSVAGDSQIQGNATFQINIQSYQGIARDWNINSIEFELQYTPATVEYLSFETEGFLSNDSLVEIIDTGYSLIVSINSDRIAGTDPLIGIDLRAIVTEGICTFNLSNFIFRDILNNEYPIYNLTGLEQEIIYINSPPAISAILEDLYLEEGFDPFSINLNEYFTDEDGDMLIYYIIYEGDLCIESAVNDSILWITSTNPSCSGTGTLEVCAIDPYEAMVCQSFMIQAQSLPYITSFNTDPAYPGEVVRVYGENFGEQTGESGVLINNELYIDIVSYWSPQAVFFYLPYFPELEFVEIAIRKTTDQTSEPLQLDLEFPSTLYFIYPNENDIVQGDELSILVTPEIRGDLITSAVFEYRAEGSADWIYIGEDDDGSGLNLSTYNEVGSGDGWSVIWDISLVDDGEIDIRVTMEDEFNQILRNNRHVTIDRTPLSPWIDFHPWQNSRRSGSTAVDEDSLSFEFTLIDDDASEVEIHFRPLGPLSGYQRDLELLDQHEVLAIDALGREVAGMACGATAAASCLKWLAEQFPDSDLNDEMGINLADELSEASHTDAEHGTCFGNLLSGIREVLERYDGIDPDDFDFGSFHVNDPGKDVYDEMISALYDSSDVILNLQQVTEEGAVLGHAVTLSSHGTTGGYQFYENFGCVYCENTYIDFMNPATGHTEYYQIDNSVDPPELLGYNLNDSEMAGNVRIMGGLTIKAKDNAPRNRILTSFSYPVSGSGDYRIAINCRDLPVGILQAELTGISNSGEQASTKVICINDQYALLPYFNADTTEGEYPLEVQFNNMSTPRDSIIAYNWNFGGIGTSTLSNPVFVYYQAGVYDVSLTITDDHGNSESITKNGYITVTPGNYPPQLELPDELYLDAWGNLEFDLLDFTIDPDSDELVFSSTTPNELTLDLAGSVVNIQSPVSWTGSEMITFFVDDQQSRATDSDSLLVIKNLNPCPILTAIEDVPSDQGGWVLVNFSSSCFDTGNLITRPGEQYTVEYLIDDVWTASNTVSAYGAPGYQILVHTIQDSIPLDPALFKFRVIACMDEGNFGSNILPGYSIDNLCPQIPDGIAFDNAYLIWNEPVDDDFDHFVIYLDGVYYANSILPQLYLTGLCGDFQIEAVDFHYNHSGLSQIANGGYPYGDVDHNLNVEAIDASYILQYFCQLITNWEDWKQIIADVDGNNAVEAYDASLILRYVTGYIDHFPVESITRSKNELNK